MRKVCNKCNVEKVINDFYTSKQGRDGYMNRCKDCHNLYSAKAHKSLLKAADMHEKTTVEGFKTVMKNLGYDPNSDISEQFKQRVMEKYGVNLL